MSSFRLVLSLSCLLLSLLLPSTATLAAEPVKLRRPLVSRASMSEDGRYVAFLTPKGKDYYDLNIYDVERGLAQKFDLKGDEVRWFRWSDAQRLVVATRNYPEYEYRLQLLNVAEHRITENLNDPAQFFLFIGSLRRVPNLFGVYFFDDGAQDGLAIIDSKLKPSGSMGPYNPRFNVSDWIKLPKGELRSWGTDPHGEFRVVSMFTAEKHQLHVRATPDSDWRLLSYDPEFCSIIGFTNDPDLIYLALYSQDAQSSRLHRYRISTGELGPALLEDPEYSVSEATILSVRQRDGKLRQLSIDYERDVFTQRALDPHFSEIQKSLNQLLPGRLNIVKSADYEVRRILFLSSNGREPERYGLYDHGTKKIHLLPDPSPDYDPKNRGVQRPLKYTTRDGLTLEGYLSLPAQIPEGTKPALVVLPHGGPWARDSWGFAEEIDLLTSRGYAVFQPNYRGSTGYNRAVSKDEDAEFRKMHDDVTDGVRHVLSLGQVDSKRVAIYGGSFGGYLAVCGAAYEADLYRCAVSFAGVFDWRMHLKYVWSQSHRFRDDFLYLQKKIGNPKIAGERFDRFSPLTQVGNIKIPLLVSHGVMDRTVHIEQSKKLIAELDRHHVPYEKKFFGEEQHGFRYNENEEEWLTILVNFLEKNL